LLCNLDSCKDSAIPSAAGYVKLGSTLLETTVGVAISGVGFFSGLSLNKVDPFYPRKWTGSNNADIEHVDTCLAHAQGSGFYHYHILPVCLFDATKAATAASCDNVSACKNDVKGYGLSGFSTKKEYTAIGIAKDGHIIR
jgi:hypothetical protein